MLFRSVALRFTGKERDAETGLDYFGARYMSAAQGRFTSPDRPFVGWDIGDPQSWNLYGYVRNSQHPVHLLSVLIWSDKALATGALGPPLAPLELRKRFEQ